MDTPLQTCKEGDAAPHLTERGLARRWKVSCRTLQRMRASGTGPAFLRIGNAIRYPIDDIRRYERLSRHHDDGAA